MIKEPKCLRCKKYIENRNIIPMCREYKKGIPMKFFREEINCKKYREKDFLQN